MSLLLGDRFVRIGASWIDLATGLGVRIHLAPAGSTRQQFLWNDRCAMLSRLRHPLLNPLIDYGVADVRRTFEAYAVAPPILTAGYVGCQLLTHVVRFLESHGLPLTRDQAALILRSAVRGDVPARGRAIGIVLQPRTTLTRLSEAMLEGRSGGPATIAITGESGSGLRTLRTLAARAARLAGYVPIAGPAIRQWPGLRVLVRERHVCVFVESPTSTADTRPVADLLADLGTASARGHFVFSFSRSSAPTAESSLEIDAMGVTALSTMVYLDPDRGPTPGEVWDAARRAGGNPGRFLADLRVARYPEVRQTPLVVHEMPPPYAVGEPGPREPAPARRESRRLSAAPERAARLADRGRHASAIRLLTRAIRVLEARGEGTLASRCTLQLAWILRNRGRSAQAADQFHRARARAVSEMDRIRAGIGLGIVWTDDGRLVEGEALLRGAYAALRLLGAPARDAPARHALARSLFWQKRYDEALLVLSRPTDDDPGIDTLALTARVHIHLGEHRPALAAAAEAVRLAMTAREQAVAARAMVVVQLAAGDVNAARASARRGLAAAARAHLPLLALRLRGELIPTNEDRDSPERIRFIAWARSALRRPLPALYRACLEQAVTAAVTASPNGPAPSVDAALSQLRVLLELAHGAPDDRAALERVASDVLVRLRAATVQIVDSSSDSQVLARAGRPWPVESRLIARVMAGGDLAEADAIDHDLEMAATVRYGDDAIGAIACRWTVGTDIDPARARDTLRAAALAVAPSLRGLVDRQQARPADIGRDELIGTSPPIVALRDVIARAARAPFPVLVEGESGSGKELVARAIHRLGPRRERRLCAVNCAALTDDLLEAELFGHARGAYTGAVGERAGLFEEADGGTLFLDEIGELSARAQAKLLRVLQDGEVRRIGENLPRRVDTRIVAATNRSLELEADAGRFRTDLRYRLDVIRIRVPPLRDRAADIAALALHFWEDSTRRLGSTATLAPETLAALTRYEWPGNVRELQNVIAAIAVHAPRRGRVTSGTLPTHVARATPAADLSFEAARVDFERRFVSAAMARAGGRRAGAARMLGVSRQGLTKMLRRLNIDAVPAPGRKPAGRTDR
jgi:transcriptional regulator with GAF, ATPase, and Fis domain/tetratricopeptide (TPR) repeat protein